MFKTLTMSAVLAAILATTASAATARRSPSTAAERFQVQGAASVARRVATISSTSAQRFQDQGITEDMGYVYRQRAPILATTASPALVANLPILANTASAPSAARATNTSSKRAQGPRNRRRG